MLGTNNNIRAILITVDPKLDRSSVLVNIIIN